MSWTEPGLTETGGVLLSTAVIADRALDRLAASVALRASSAALASASALAWASAFAWASAAAFWRAASSAAFCSAAALAAASAEACCAVACWPMLSLMVCAWAPEGTSASRVAPATSTVCVVLPSLPEAMPTTAPTAVTAVAEATATPRTEIRVTWIPSSIAHA